MEGIKSLAQSIFDQEQKFVDPGPRCKYDAVELRVLSGGAEDHRDVGRNPGQEKPLRLSLNPDQLCTWLLPSAMPNNDAEVDDVPRASATLRLVCIPRNLDISLGISKSSFTRILEGMKADPSIKYMICRDYDGFHEYNGDGFRLTRFMGTALYALVWTFDPASMTTTALFLDRRRECFPRFVDNLSAFRSYIHTPSLLCFQSCHFLVQFFDYETGVWEITTVQHIEGNTGFGPHPTGWRGAEPRAFVQKFHIDQLTSWLQAVTEVAGNASNRLRQIENSRVLLELIRKEHDSGEYHGIPSSTLGTYESSVKSLLEALPSVERHMSTCMDYVIYRKERAERLAGVVRIFVCFLVGMIHFKLTCDTDSYLPCSPTKMLPPASALRRPVNAIARP
jgi:hypothetical protein